MSREWPTDYGEKIGSWSKSRDWRHLDLERFAKSRKFWYFAVFLGASKVLFPGVPGLCPLMHGKTRPLTTHDGHNHRCCLLFVWAVALSNLIFENKFLTEPQRSMKSNLKVPLLTNSKQHRWLCPSWVVSGLVLPCIRGHSPGTPGNRTLLAPKKTAKYKIFDFLQKHSKSRWRWSHESDPLPVFYL